MTFEGLQIQGAIKIMEKLTVSEIQFYQSDHYSFLIITLNYFQRLLHHFLKIKLYSTLH